MLIVATAPGPKSGFVMPAAATPKSPSTTAILEAIDERITALASTVPVVAPAVSTHCGVSPGTIGFHSYTPAAFIMPATSHTLKCLIDVGHSIEKL